MANKSAILSIRIISDASGADKTFQQTGDAAGGLSGKLTGKLGPGLIAAGAGFLAAAKAAVEVGKYLYSVGETFDEVEDTIRVKTGAMGDDLDGLVDSAKNVGGQVPAEFEAIGPVIGDLNTRLGLSGKTLETVASQYLEAGRMLGEEVNIDTTTKAFTAFGIEGDKVIGGMDTLWNVSQTTGVSMNSLADSISKQAPALGMLGFSFEESAGMVGVLDKAGMDADKTLAAMGKGLVTLAKQGEEPAAAFQRVTGEIGDLLASGDEAKALDLASTLFGTRGASQFVGALQSGVLEADNLQAAFIGTGDSILQAGEDTMDAAEKWQILKNKALTALEPIGSAIFSGVGAALDWVMELIDNFSFDGMSDAAAPLGDVWAEIQEFGQSVIDFLYPIFQQWVPIVETAINTVTSLIQPALDIITGIFQAAGALLRGDWASVWAGIQQIVQGGIDFVINIFTGLISLLSQIGGNLVQTVSNMWTSIVGWFQSGATAIGQWWSSGWNSMISTVTSIPGRITGALGNLGGLLYQKGRDVVQGFLNGIGSLASTVGNWFLDKLPSWIVGPFKTALGISSPSKVFYRFGRDTVTGYLNAISAGRSLVSDSLAQLVAAPEVPQITMNPATRWAGNTAQQIIYITVQGALDPIGTARQIKDLLDQQSRRVGTIQIGAPA